MKESRSFKVILIVLALPLVIFGGWRLVDPIGFYIFSGLDLPDYAELLSEVRGAGGVIMVSGLVVGLGAFRHAWSRTSVVLAAVVFLSLGLARLLGITLDGSPGTDVIQGMAIELVFGGLALFAFYSYRDGGRLAQDNTPMAPVVSKQLRLFFSGSGGFAEGAQRVHVLVCRSVLALLSSCNTD